MTQRNYDCMLMNRNNLCKYFPYFTKLFHEALTHFFFINRSDFDTVPLNIDYGDIYFGGLPKGFITPKNALATTAYFTGCISDVTMSGQVVNFANSTDRKSAVLDNCPRDILGLYSICYSFF